MSLFGRKKEELSRLPMIPEVPGIPSFPELPNNPNQDQSKNDFQDFRPLPPEPLENISYPKPLVQRMTMEIDNPNMFENSQLPPAPNAISTSTAPVFIKLEKFQDALIKFGEIKKGINEVNSALIKLKEVREKEEAELRAWELDISQIKEKTKSIESSLFNKLQ